MADGTSELLYYDFLNFCRDWEYIFTPEINEYLERYNMHKEGVVSYGQVYDELPSVWLDCLSLINKEVNEAQKAWKRMNGTKNT